MALNPTPGATSDTHGTSAPVSEGNSKDSPVTHDFRVIRDLLFAQLNLKGVSVRYTRLREFLRDMPGPPFDFIAIQDPPLEFAYISHEDYWSIYRSPRVLTTLDHPRSQRDQRNNDVSRKPVKISGWAFLIHNTLHRRHWEVLEHNDENIDLVATLNLNTSAGWISVHNIYNRGKEVNLETLSGYLVPRRAHVSTGDWNLSLDDSAQMGYQAWQLRSVMRAAGMRLIQTPDPYTYTRNTTDNASKIDGTFASLSIADIPGVESGSQYVPGFESDHRLQRTYIPGLTLKHKKPFHGPPKRLPGPEIKLNAKRAFEGLELLPLPDPDATERFAEEMMKRCQSIDTNAAPLVPSDTSRKPLPAQIRLNYILAKFFAMQQKTEPATPRTQAHWHNLQNRFSHTARTLYDKEKKRSFRSMVTEKTKTSQGTFQLARRANSWMQPKNPPHMHDLSHNGKTYKRDEEKAQFLHDHIWPDLGDNSSELDYPESSTESSTDPPEQAYQSDQTLKTGEYSEVAQIIKHLRSGAAAGEDGLGNWLLKETLPVLQPFIEHLFEACIRLSYHPSVFKHAKTVMCKKKGKTSYASPDSWRPIALLCCLGKVLETIMAKRFADLEIGHAIVSSAQFAGQGKSTTKALRSLLEQVYEGWCRKLNRRDHWKTTVVCLDMKGAYNRVNRKSLLRTLKSLRIPPWLIEYVRSFLSGRSTTIVMPGAPPQGPFPVDIGLSQGSPISTILFCLFTTPLLNKLSIGNRLGSIEKGFAFADDMYLVATSPSYAQNCKILEKMHGKVMKWAKENGASFDKYEFMHFRRPAKKGSQVQVQDLEVPQIPELAGQKAKEWILMLGVYVDSELRWNIHIQKTLQKAREKSAYLSYMSASTWGTTPNQLRQLYLQKTRPGISYACGVWFLTGTGTHARWRINNGLILKLEKFQNVELRRINGAYKSSPIQCLQKEAYVEPMEMYLERVATQFRVKEISKQHPVPFGNQEPIGRVIQYPSSPRLYEFAWDFPGRQSTGTSEESGWPGTPVMISGQLEWPDLPIVTSSSQRRLQILDQDRVPGPRSHSTTVYPPLRRTLSVVPRWPRTAASGQQNSTGTSSRRLAKRRLRSQFSDKWPTDIIKPRLPYHHLHEDHPYRQVADGDGNILAAFEKEEGDDWTQESRTEGIKSYLEKAFELQAKARWNMFREPRLAQPDSARVYWDDWGPHNVKRYSKLSRERSTMAFQFRTEHIGFRDYLSRRKYKNHESQRCDCGNRQTALHLFCHCPKLWQQRELLRHELGHSNWNDLMDKNVDVAAEWALQFFPLLQFSRAKDNSPNRFARNAKRLQLDPCNIEFARPAKRRRLGPYNR